MICKHCGAENANEYAFCAGCGAALNTAEDDSVNDIALDEEEVIDTSLDMNDTPQDKGKIFGIISLCVGGASILLTLLLLFGSCLCSCFCSLITIPAALGLILTGLMGIAGIVLGIVGMVLSKKSNAKPILSLIGMIVGIAGTLLPLVIGVIYVFIVVVGVGAGFLSELMAFSDFYDSSYYY